MFSQGTITPRSESTAMDASLKRHQLHVCFTARTKINLPVQLWVTATWHRTCNAPLGVPSDPPG